MSRMPRSKGPAKARSSTSRIGALARRGGDRSSFSHPKGPDGILHELSQLEPGHATPHAEPEQPLLPYLVMPAHHDVRGSDVITRRLRGNLAAAADRGPTDFAELLLTPGVGGRTVRALAMVAEVVHGAPYRFSDPARFSFAHGGKDRHPFPVPLKVYDETIRVLKSAVRKARLGRDEELGALQRLDAQARMLEGEGCPEGMLPEDLIAHERKLSHAYGGRSVFGWEQSPALPVTRGDGTSSGDCNEQERHGSSLHARRGAT
jgi:uncharacterized protein